MKTNTKQHALWAGLALCALVLSSMAQTLPLYVAGSFNGWTANGNLMTETSPGSGVWTMTTNLAAGRYEFKITEGDWSWARPGANSWLTNAVDGGSVTITYNTNSVTDGWLPTSNRIGVTADSGTWTAVGDWQGWANGNPATVMTNQGSGIYHLAYVIPAKGTHQYKAVDSGSWDAIGSDSRTINAGTVYFTTTATNQVVDFYVDALNGVIKGPPPVVYVTNDVTFQVDMSVQTNMSAFNPGSDQLYLVGDFNNWVTSASPLTNDPTGSNPNLWSYTTNIPAASGSAVGYKFWSSNPGQTTIHNSYEYPASTGGNNRTLTFLTTNGSITLPDVYWSDTQPNDVLTSDVEVTFTVDMTGAVNFTNSANAFNPGASGAGVWLNGDFLGTSNTPPYNIYGWLAWANDGLMPQLVNINPPGSNYSVTVRIPKGNPVALQYSYTFEPTRVFDETTNGLNHVRYIREVATGSYTLPTDSFANMYQEPSFGYLSAKASAGKAAISWLGRPGVNLQSKGNVTSGSWADVAGTDGYTLTSSAGTTTNGWLSLTNYPPTGTQNYFRLIKPAQLPTVNP